MQHADRVTSQAVVDLGTADLTNAMLLLVRQPLLLYECTLTSCLCYQGAVADIKWALYKIGDNGRQSCKSSTLVGHSLF